jgi:hypothetical protein
MSRWLEAAPPPAVVSPGGRAASVVAWERWHSASRTNHRPRLGRRLQRLRLPRRPSSRRCAGRERMRPSRSVVPEVAPGARSQLRVRGSAVGWPPPWRQGSSRTGRWGPCRRPRRLPLPPPSPGRSSRLRRHRSSPADLSMEAGDSTNPHWWPVMRKRVIRRWIRHPCLMVNPRRPCWVRWVRWVRWGTSGRRGREVWGLRPNRGSQRSVHPIG